MRAKVESGKTDLKFNIQKTKIKASGPIISWQIEVKKWIPRPRALLTEMYNAYYVPGAIPVFINIDSFNIQSSSVK